MSEVKALPPTRWHSRQWQLKEKTGSAEHSYRIAPQAQPPVKKVPLLCSDIWRPTFPRFPQRIADNPTLSRFGG